VTFIFKIDILITDYKNIQIENYNYLLPEHRIAKYPIGSRDESKLLYFENGNIDSLQFKQLPELLQSTDLLIFNNAKVIQARLNFVKESGAHIEIFCLEPFLPADYNLAFQVSDCCEWKCLVGNLKKWKSGKLIKKIKIKNSEYVMEALHVGKTTNSEIIRFTWYPSKYQLSTEIITFGNILENIGLMPLPPYLNRQAETEDKIRYQTIYAMHKGSVAAPTAGLHFTDSVFNSLKLKGVQTQNITLHVGAGTFRPVKSLSIEGHDMHEENFQIEKTCLNQLINHKGRVIAVGTTSARTLESLYWIGLKIIANKRNTFKIDQWEVYEKTNDVALKTSLKAIEKYMERNSISVLQASTKIIIVPGYQFKTIKGLVTNFHQPQSTLLLLIAAAVGERWHQIYDFALDNDYRFLSYGDSSMLLI
jgi:S-adenosylmethionine:tRNA ribosyltransferase-isomerase